MKSLYVAFGVVLLATVGCQWKGGQPEASSPNGHAGPAAWQIRPVSMRVYPSSKLTVTEAGQPLLEARIEFLDAANDTVKAVGKLRFELYRGASAGRGAKIYHWDVEMLTQAQNESYYDSITRAYLFQLQLDDLPRKDDEVTLAVTYLPAEFGPRLKATTQLSGS